MSEAGECSESTKSKCSKRQFKALSDCFGRDAQDLSKVVLTKKAILMTLKKMKHGNVNAIKYSNNGEKVSATFK